MTNRMAGSGTCSTTRRGETVSANSRPPSGEVQPGQPKIQNPGRPGSAVGRRNFTWLEREVEQGLINLTERHDRMSVGNDEELKQPARWRVKAVEALNTVPMHTMSHGAPTD